MSMSHRNRKAEVAWPITARRRGFVIKAFTLFRTGEIAASLWFVSGGGESLNEKAVARGATRAARTEQKTGCRKM